MSRTITVELSEKQYHIIEEMARTEYRTIENTWAMLAANGFIYILCDRDVCVKKLEEDRDFDGPEVQFYNDKEMEAIVGEIPLKQ